MLTTTLATLFVLAVPSMALGAGKEVGNSPVSSGVTYSKKVVSSSKYINQLSVDLTDPFTKLDIGVPAPINKVQTTTSLANRDSREGYSVVGAVNASFFDMTSGLPMYLISEKNSILNGGVISKASSFYVSQPIAFGVTKNGLAEIDHYNFGVKLQYKGNTHSLTGMNRERQNSEAIIFTPQFHHKSTNMNKYGFEVAIETGAPVTSTTFGQKLEGKVVEIRQYGSEKNLDIPKDGFVLSVHGQPWYDKFAHMQVGESVSLSLSIDDKWMDSEFMLASGPMLVKDGKRHITMDTSNWRATAVTARTAIAISKDKKKVGLVTVDSRSGHSTGMTLIQFADYLAAEGYDRAINFDGGGSTAMGVHNVKSNNITLANRPTGAERRVSAVVRAISTESRSEAKSISVSREKTGAMLVGATATLKLNSVLDSLYTPMKADLGKIKITTADELFTFSGLSYTAVRAGVDRMNIRYDNATQSFPITVVDAPTTLTISPSSSTVKPNDSLTFSATAKDAGGNALVYSPGQLKWSVSGDIGTISQAGQFKAANASGKGQVTATLGTKSVTIPVEVKQVKYIFKDISSDYAYFNEINYLKDKGIIKGDLDGKFNPGNSLSREHAAVILSRAFDFDTTQEGKLAFTDVPKTHRYYKEISAIANANLVGGKGDGRFDPAGQLTRAQMASILVKAYGLSVESTKRFKDVLPSYWAYKDIHILAESGITTGNEQGNFEPGKPVNRAQFSAFLYRGMTK